MEFDFAANTVVDDLNTVPENFRSVYEKNADGKFGIGPNFKGVVEALTGLNGALRNERRSTQTLKSQKDVGAVIKEALGFDTVDEVKARLDELSQQVLERSKVDPAKIKADIEKTFNTEREALKADNLKMQGSLERYLIDSAATAALAEAKGNVKLLLPIIKQLTAVVKDGEEYVVRVKDPVGDYRGDGKGGFMSVADLVKELKGSADYGVAFASDAPAGGGKQPVVPPQQRSQQPGRSSEDKTPQDMIRSGLEARRGRR